MADNKKNIDNALKEITKKHGKGSVMMLGENPRKINAISTGSILLDKALGVGGFPRGRIIEVYGVESSGKTTLALHSIAEAQKNDGIAAFIDAEHALDPKYAKTLGIDTENLIVSQPDTGEQALEITESLIRSNAVDIVVIDSVAALVPEAEIRGDMGASHIGLQARLMSQAMRKISGATSESDTLVLFINQIREKVGVMFGNPETTPGGRALKFYSSARVEVRRGEQLKKGNEPIGNRVKFKVVKNKVAPPFKNVEVDLVYGEGLSKEGEILDLAVAKEIVDKKGSWFSYNGQKIGQGKENVKAFLKENKEIMLEIKDKLVNNEKED